MARNRDWCFTINGLPQLEVAAIQAWDAIYQGPAKQGYKYLVCQLEQGQQGHYHIQGYASFNCQKTLTAARDTIRDSFGLGDPHIEPRRGTPAQASDYCKKDATRVGGTMPYEQGDRPGEGPGGRGKPLQLAIAAIESGSTLDDVAREHPSAYVTHHRGLEQLAKRLRRKPIEYHSIELRDWQRDLVGVLFEPAHPRQVLWIYDTLGNKGKTWFANWVYDTCNKEDYQVLIFGNQKSADLAYAIEYPKIVFFDFTRAQEEQLNWSAIEMIKNGTFFSPKYESNLKRFPTPHVVIFSNFSPEPYKDKLSADRWNVKEI